MGDCRIVGQTTRALNGFVEVGDDAVAPAAVLVAKDAQAHGAASANGTLCNHATLLAMFVGDWGLLDHKPSAREVHFKSAVVEIVAFTVVDHRVTRLVDATVQPDEVAACAQRQPVEVHPGAQSTTLLEVLSEPARDEAGYARGVLQHGVMAPIIGDVQLDQRRGVSERAPRLLPRRSMLLWLAAGDQQRRHSEVSSESSRILPHYCEDQIGHADGRCGVANLAVDLEKQIANVSLERGSALAANHRGQPRNRRVPARKPWRVGLDPGAQFRSARRRRHADLGKPLDVHEPAVDQYRRAKSVGRIARHASRNMCAERMADDRAAGESPENVCRLIDKPRVGIGIERGRATETGRINRDDAAR